MLVLIKTKVGAFAQFRWVLCFVVYIAIMLAVGTEARAAMMLAESSGLTSLIEFEARIFIIDMTALNGRDTDSMTISVG